MDILNSFFNEDEIIENYKDENIIDKEAINKNEITIEKNEDEDEEIGSEEIYKRTMENNKEGHKKDRKNLRKLF